MRARYCSPLVVVLVAGVAAPASGQVVIFPHVDAKVAGDMETKRGGAGVSVGYYLPAWRGLGVGLEVGAGWYGHFFRDQDVASLVPAGVDLNTDALVVMSNLVMPVSIPRAPIWRPYATAGLGVIRAIFVVPGDDIEQNDLALNAGVGMMHQLNRFLGLRADMRYYHAFVDEQAREGGYFKDYDFWNVSVGVTLQLPMQRWPDPW